VREYITDDANHKCFLGQLFSLEPSTNHDFLSNSSMMTASIYSEARNKSQPISLNFCFSSSSYLSIKEFIHPCALKDEQVGKDLTFSFVCVRRARQPTWNERQRWRADQHLGVKDGDREWLPPNELISQQRFEFSQGDTWVHGWASE